MTFSSIIIHKRFRSVSFFLILLTIGVFTLMPSPSVANGKKISAKKSKTQHVTNEEKRLHITSDTMEVEKASSVIRFSGNVVVTQQNSTIQADTIIVVLFSETEKKALSKANQQTIKMMTAEGNVQFTSETQKAFADKATYTALDQRLVLTGDAPKVITGESYVTGKKITLYQDSEKVVVEGDTQKRVEALFNTTDNDRIKGSF